jgi:hypothetical protein
MNCLVNLSVGHVGSVQESYFSAAPAAYNSQNEMSQFSPRDAFVLGQRFEFVPSYTCYPTTSDNTPARWPFFYQTQKDFPSLR